MKIYYLPIVALYICSCSPKVIVNAQEKLRETKPYEGFVIFGIKDTFNTNEGKYLGSVKIQDGGFALDCTYEVVTKLAEREARKLGGNALKIVVHKLPDVMVSTCHRITANVYKLPSITKYEKKIIWHASRKLQQTDFKGSIENRPFEAATASTFSWNYSGSRIKGKVKFEVTTYFDCERSYFKGTSHVEEVLAHEQGHFDITELYARKFLKKVSEEVKNLKDLEGNLGKIYDDVTKELQLEQDRYDSDIYPDQTKQASWLKSLQEELTKYEKYTNKEVFLKI